MWALTPPTSVLRRGTQRRDTEGRRESHMKEEQRPGQCGHGPRKADGHQRLGEGSGSLLGPPERVWSCCCLKLRLLASGTVNECISVGSGHPVERAGHSEAGKRRLTKNTTAASKRLPAGSLHAPRRPLDHPTLTTLFAIFYLSFETLLKCWILRGHVFLSYIPYLVPKLLQRS